MLDGVKVRQEVIGILDETEKYTSKSDSKYEDLTRPEFNHLMEAKFEYLFTNAKTLFLMALSGSVDMRRLDEMLAMLKRMERGLSEFDASKEIGQSLADTYVKPLVDKLEKKDS